MWVRKLFSSGLYCEVFNICNFVFQLASVENVNSDILQQALENSGLTIPPDAQAGVTKNGPKKAGVIDILNKVVMGTMTIQDSATGTLKKHVIRKVSSDVVDH